LPLLSRSWLSPTSGNAHEHRIAGGQIFQQAVVTILNQLYEVDVARKPERIALHHARSHPKIMMSMLGVPPKEWDARLGEPISVGGGYRPTQVRDSSAG
jgi:hypothetical protein